MVRVEDEIYVRIYVRSVNGPTSDWLRATRSRHEGRVRAMDVEHDPADPQPRGRLHDQAAAAALTDTVGPSCLLLSGESRSSFTPASSIR